MRTVMFLLAVLSAACTSAASEGEERVVAQASATGDYDDCDMTSVNPEPGQPVVQCLFMACHGNFGPPSTYDCKEVQRSTNCGWYLDGVAQDTNGDGTPDRCCWQDRDSPGGRCEVTVTIPAPPSTTPTTPAPTTPTTPPTTRPTSQPTTRPASQPTTRPAG